MNPDSPISALQEPWLRLPPKLGKGGATESPKSFAVFECFLDLPPAERSISRLAQRRGSTVKSLEKLSSKYYWLERASAWDRHQAEARAEAKANEEQKRARAEVELWTKRKQEVRDKKYQTGQALVEKGEAHLKLPNTERVMKRQDGSNIVLQPRRTKDAVELIRAGYQLQDEAVNEGLDTNCDAEEIHDYEFDDYIPTKSDSPAPNSVSGPPEPADVP